MDGDTVGEFDPITGNYSFVSEDILQYPEGTYTFEVTTVAGIITVVDTFDMTLLNPCPITNLALVSRIPDQVYTFF